jgi:dTDP-L-rhamnose 4-epimerase
MNRVLITGGAGFIGSSLAIALARRGWRVTVLDNLSPQIHGQDPSSSPLIVGLRGYADLVHGDVTDRPILASTLRDQDAVVHFAAETGTGQSMYQIDRYTKVNIGGTSLLLDLLAGNKGSVKRLLVASSRSIYGEGKYCSKEVGIVYPLGRRAENMRAGNFEVTYPGCITPLTLLPTDEQSRIHPSSVYGITKQFQEQMVMTVAPAIGIEGVALRYQNVYGPGQSLSNPYTGILSIFSNLIMQGRALNVFEDGQESRDFVFIDDVVEATVLALEQPSAANEVFNVGSGTPTSILTVARELSRVIGKEVPISVSGDFRIGDIRHNYACLDKARRLLGYKPKVAFAEGIAEFARWALDQGPRLSDYDRSLREMKDRGLLGHRAIPQSEFLQPTR